MRIKLFAAGAAIALAATIGSASAADQFSTLEGIAAEALTPHEMGAIIGAATLFVGPDAAVDPASGFPFDVVEGPPNKPVGNTDGMEAGLITGLSGGTLEGGSGVVVFTP